MAGNTANIIKFFSNKFLMIWRLICYYWSYFFQVLASFISPLGVTINHEATIDDISLDVSDEDITNVLPSLPEILLNSCLIPTLASYLRNDSGIQGGGGLTYII